MVAMQTVSPPYRCSPEDRYFLTACRRTAAAAVRTAYANAIGPDGKPRTERDLRDLVKARFAGGGVDAWTLHCATLEGMDLRKLVPDGGMIFGGKKAFEDRLNGLIDKDEWKRARLRPLTTRGDKTMLGNRHFRLAADCRTCTFRMYGRKVELHLPEMTGNAGECLRQAAALAAAKKINLTFRIDDERLQVTFDPADLPEHPERRKPVKILPGRAVGIDLNPCWIGLSAIENAGDSARLEETRLLDWKLIKLEHEADGPKEIAREVLAVAADRAVRLARQVGTGVIAVEKGLGKLRSSGKNSKLNQLLNYWGRTVFLQILRRKAGLAGIKVVEVWGGYSTTIGNAAFEAPDACASACEIARRALALRAGVKDLLPAFPHDVSSGLWKDLPMRNELREELARADQWVKVHRAVKAAKEFGYRRPHPRLDADPGGRHTGGIAVRRLGRRRRPGLLARPVGTRRPAQASSVNRELRPESTRKSE
jgi:IS605 OrfB family transposase